MIKPKKIVIDARMYGLEHAGIGRYVMNLVQELKNLKTEKPKNQETKQLNNFEFYLLVRKGKFKEIKKEVGERFRLVVAEAPHYSFKEQLLLPIQLLKLRPDLVHFPHFNVPIFWWGKQIVTIHDLIKHESRGPETTTRWRPFYWLKYFVHKFVVWLAVKRAARIIVPSKWWKKELIRRYGLSGEKVIVTYEGVDEKLKVENSKLKINPEPSGQKFREILNKYGVRRPFILYVGNLYPHKNVERLVKAMKLVNNSHNNYHAIRQQQAVLGGQAVRGNYLKLVVACGRNVFYERFQKKVKKMGVDKLVKLIGFADDEKLVALYTQAEAFVFPSLAEGFGLPGLEAMACGCLVVASDIPVLKEIYGKAALYFDPLDVADMARKIKKVTGSKSRRNQLVKNGFNQVKRYSWPKMAKETLEVYKQAVSA